MLRWLALTLLLANLGLWAWTSGLLGDSAVLVGPGSQREPQRLARQVRPEAVRVLQRAPAASAARPSVAGAQPASPQTTALAGPVAADCLQIGPVAETGLEATVRRLQALGIDRERWVDIRIERPGRWAVYMGRYGDPEQMRRKLDELAKLRLPHEELVGHDSLSPGITLGRFTNPAEAQARLTQLQNRGVHTARVVALAAAAVDHRIQVKSLNASERAALSAPNPAGGLAWQACEPTVSAASPL